MCPPLTAPALTGGFKDTREWGLKVRSEEATGAKTSGIILPSHSLPQDMTSPHSPSRTTFFSQLSPGPVGLFSPLPHPGISESG